MWEEHYDVNGNERDKIRYEVGIDWERKNRHDLTMRYDSQDEVRSWIKERDPEGFLGTYGCGFFYDIDVAMLFYLTFKKPS